MTRTRFFTNSTLGMFFAKFRLRKLPLFHVEHGSNFVILSSAFKTFVARVYDATFGKLNFQLANVCGAVSLTSKEFVEQEFLHKKKSCYVLHRGVDFELYTSTRSSLTIAKRFKGKTVITCLCRFYKWKGLVHVIKAFKALSEEERGNSVLLLVGYGEERKRLEKEAGEEKDKTIFFLGKQSFRKAISILKATDIFVHASFPGGGLSNSLLQAMVCGCAVVASPHEGAREVINQKTGVLLNDNSVASLRKGLQQLLADEHLRSQLQEQAKTYVYEHFSWHHVCDRYEELFNKL